MALHELPTRSGAAPASQDLFRAETYALTLELTATYVDTSTYAVSGTFQFGDGAPRAVEGSVCVPEGLRPQALEVQTSPIFCGVDLTVAGAQRPSWVVGGSGPFGTPPVAFLEVRHDNDYYFFEVARQGR